MKKVLRVLVVFLLILNILPIGISGWNVPAIAAEPVIVQISVGENHSLALFSDPTPIPTPALTSDCGIQTPTPPLTHTPMPKFTPPPTPTPTPMPPEPMPPANVISIAAAQTTVYLKKGSSATLGVVPVTCDISAVKLTWVSNDPYTVSVTQTGKVKAHKAGSAIITAVADNGKFIEINVIVGGKTAKSISIKNPPKSNTMTIGDVLKLNIAVEPANAQGVITFMSTNKKVVSIDAAGRLKALRNGSAFIVVMMGTKAATLYLKVN